MFIEYLNSGVSNYNHELIEVIVPANVTIHKMNHWYLATRAEISESGFFDVKSLIKVVRSSPGISPGKLK